VAAFLATAEVLCDELTARGEAVEASMTQVRFCRDRFSATGELGYSGIRGAAGLGYRFTVQAYPIVIF
jgi:hypothetical protein